MGLHVEIMVAPLPVLQRIGVRHQMAAHPIGIDHLHDPGLLGDLVLVEATDILRPADGLVGDAQCAEDVVVEAVLAKQQRVQAGQVLARLRPLNDPVVIRRRQRQDLGYAHVAEPIGVGPLELWRVLHGAHADDRPLTLHQAGDRVIGADGSRVGQRNRGASEIFECQLPRSCLLHHLLVCRPELGEVQRLAPLDTRHQQLTGAILLGQVDGQAEIDMSRYHQCRLAIDDVIAVVHGWNCLQSLHHGVTNDVGVRDLAAARPAQVVVDHHALVDEQLDR